MDINIIASLFIPQKLSIVFVYYHHSAMTYIVSALKARQRRKPLPFMAATFIKEEYVPFR